MRVSTSAKAYAKINWFLGIVGVFPDGYHRVRTLLQSIDLSDELSIREKKSGEEGEDRLSFRGSPIRLNGENLASLAARAFMKEFSIGRDILIDIEKKIPLGAGLGGGSADAAAVLRALREMWGVSADESRFMEAAASLGADVPFGLVGGLALAEGSGSEIHPLQDVPSQCLLLLEPSFSISTAWAYGEWDRLHGSGPSENQGKKSRIESLIDALKDGDPAKIAPHLHNDMEEAVIPSHPEIWEMKKVLLQAGALGSLMSGSGSVVYGLFSDKEAAERARDVISGGRWKAHLARTLGRSDL
ncbi:MAG: 4-(cytidine 5'-diphospho)-2-C-methyl-D-erythritol kinase [bacterium]